LHNISPKPKQGTTCENIVEKQRKGVIQVYHNIYISTEQHAESSTATITGRGLTLSSAASTAFCASASSLSWLLQATISRKEEKEETLS